MPSSDSLPHSRKVCVAHSFRTCKYRPNYPRKPFETVEEARTWTLQFVRCYNHQHKHSGLKFVTPAQRHGGKNPLPRALVRCLPVSNWVLKGEVWLNPERLQPEILKQAA